MNAEDDEGWGKNGKTVLRRPGLTFIASIAYSTVKDQLGVLSMT
jgi:hypothetical protein